MDSPEVRRVRFSVLVIALAALAVVLFLIAPALRAVLPIAVIAVLIILPLDSVVQWLTRRGLPRWAAVTQVMVLLLFTAVIMIAFLAPPLIAQGQQFIASAPALWTQIVLQLTHITTRFPALEHVLKPDQFITSLISGAEFWVDTARSVFTSTISVVASTLLILVITFYTLLNPRPLLYGLRGLFPASWWGTLERIAVASAAYIRAWALGTLALSVIIGILDYMALLLINVIFMHDVPFIVLFAILGGMLEVLPVIGPAIAAILPTLVGMAIDPALGITVLAAFLLIQQLENLVIGPLVFQRAVHLHPVSLIVTLLILSALFGIFGAVIAVPVASVVKVLYDVWYYPLLHHGESPQPV